MDRQIDTERIFTIPNILSMFRIVLAGVFALVYFNAKTRTGFYWAVAVLALSGLTDFADGKIARHFHMVSELGKFLDPLADKLTQAVVACCLCWSFPVMKLLLIVLVGKELGQGFYALYMYRLTGHNVSSMWCGKITTFYLYAMMVLFLLVPGLPEWLTFLLILLGVGLLIWSLNTYLGTFRRIVQDAQNMQNTQNTQNTQSA